MHSDRQQISSIIFQQKTETHISTMKVVQEMCVCIFKRLLLSTSLCFQL
jgi:hypothetical protein